jgi:hypothetical protein
MLKTGLWLLAPVSYGTMSVLLFSFAGRASSALGHDLQLGQLLDPRHFSFGYARFALVVTVIVLAVAVMWRSQLAILVTLHGLFVAFYIDVLRFIAIVPTKIDFRLVYPIELGLQLAWLSALCCIAASIVHIRTRLRSTSTRASDSE